jgi:hypothetical protein
MNPDCENADLPMAEILMLCGFFMIYIVEELTHALVEMCHKKSPVGGKSRSRQQGDQMSL